MQKIHKAQQALGGARCQTCIKLLYLKNDIFKMGIE
jgi:hypothetical protein